jgi:hypothetical protein
VRACGIRTGLAQVWTTFDNDVTVQLAHLSQRERSDRALARDPGEGIRFTRFAITPSPGMVAKRAHSDLSPPGSKLSGQESKLLCLFNQIAVYQMFLRSADSI